MTIVSAGHDFPMIEFNEGTEHIHEDNRIKGTALGIALGAQYSEITYPLNHIKSILLFTDGIYEASNLDDQEWGIEKLKQEYDIARANQLSSSVQHIYEKAIEWMGSSQFQDDVCLLNLEIV
jgi:serine phosphatase RsbU (regulator of sigma subunit)